MVLTGYVLCQSVQHIREGGQGQAKYALSCYYLTLLEEGQPLICVRKSEQQGKERAAIND